jgi:Domain of unknown function (DUF4157)
VERLRGGGMPLPARERALFEPLLGVDLGSVRVHTGVAAMQSASALNARAYTLGSDIAFGSGQYRPGTSSGRRLLAHELVHTVQQGDRAGPVRRDAEQKGTPAEVDVTPAAGEQETVAPGQQEQPSSRPPFGYYVSLPRKEWSRKKRQYVEYSETLQYTTQGTLKLAVFRERVTSATGATAYVLKTIKDADWFESKDLAELQRLFWRVDRTYWIVVPDPPEEARKESGPPGWVQTQQQSVRKRLKARAKGPRGDTPDRIEVWQKKTTGQWWLIVTVNFDTEGKDRSSVAMPLREGEPPGKLMARVKGATQKAYVTRAEHISEKLTEQAPKWARDLRKGLWRALDRLRKQEPGKEDFPDQLTLDVGRPGEATLQEAGALPPVPPQRSGEPHLPVKPRKRSISRSGST